MPTTRKHPSGTTLTRSKIPIASALIKNPSESPEVNEDEDVQIVAVKRTLRSTTHQIEPLTNPKRKRSPTVQVQLTPSPDLLKNKKLELPRSSSSTPVSSRPRVSSVLTNTIKGKGINQLQKLKAAAKLDNKNKEISKKTKSIKFHGTSWVDRNFPQSIDELFVHKKKVEEVQNWFRAALQIDKNTRKVGNIAVLTGPSGSGKTATLFLVAKELQCDVKEWINPMSLTDFNANRLSKFEFGDEVQGKSQLEMFTTFIFRASTYTTLPIKGRPKYPHKIVLVEDFPNMFYRDNSSFHNILRSYVTEGGSPLVFIIPDSSSSDSNAFKLFTKNIMQELNIACLSFNPIAASFMSKFLLNVCTKEGVPADKTLVESISIACGGDIRCAINTLQFKLMRGSDSVASPNIPTTFKVPTSKKAVKKSKTFIGSKSDTVEKDETLFLFRALGKVLYSKRDETLKVETGTDVPIKAIEYLRTNPLQDNVEDFVDKIEVSADTFLNFLQQNYVQFFDSMDDIVSASSFLADSEYILSRWPFDDSGIRSNKTREAKEEIALLVASRGIMYSNMHKRPNSWKPLRKPMFGDVRAQLQKSVELVSHLFEDDGAIQQNFYTETLPFYAKVLKRHPYLWASDQVGFIKEIGTFKKGHRPKDSGDTFLEKDIFDEEDSEMTLPSEQESNSNSISKQNYIKPGMDNTARLQKHSVSELEEEFLIEEYESD